MTDFTPDLRTGVSHEQARKVLWASRGCCHYCGDPINSARDDWQCDHVIPLALGGSDAWSNIRAIHVHCHKLKTRTDIKAIAKARRIAAKHAGGHKPPRYRLPGHRDHYLKRKVSGRTVVRSQDT